MLRLREIRLSIDHSQSDLERAALERLGLGPGDLLRLEVRRRSTDARKRGVVLFNYTLDAEVADEAGVLLRLGSRRDVARAREGAYCFCDASISPPAPALGKRPIVVGAGPCGLFAALALARAGREPILLERGKKARARAADVARFWRSGQLDPESNAQFGEGGAGTFSDGKLTTQIKDRHFRCARVLEELVEAGAPEEILYLSKPHIGVDNLIEVVSNLRRTIERLGGSARFGARVDDLIVEGGAVRGVALAGGEQIEAEAVVLAVGHSARDTFEMLARRGARIEPKPFSIGARIEHPQSWLDGAQYGAFAGHARLGAADYKLAHHCSNGRSVYSFCMCPGGRVIAAASEAGGVTTNGMSDFARSGENANSAILVGVRPEDFLPDAAADESDRALAGVAFQRRWERAAFALGGGDYRAPAQLVGDFLAGRRSKRMGAVRPSYTPGVRLADLADCLPGYVVEAMREGIVAFDRKLRGFALPDATLTGVESRSSSPVRLTRDGTSLESLSVGGLFPAGEGAGYAGGIVSAAVDGLRVAEAVFARFYGKL